MGKRVKYQLGDVFEIPLDDQKKGLGRVVHMDKPLIIIELYSVNPELEYSIEEIREAETLLTIWSANHGLRDGEWKIRGNVVLESNFKLPLLAKIDHFDPTRIFLVPSEYFMKENEREKSKIVTLDQKGNAQPYGVFDKKAVELRYIHELKNRELW